VVCVEPLPHLVASVFSVCAKWAVPRQGNVEHQLFVLCVYVALAFHELSCGIQSYCKVCMLFSCFPYLL